MRFIHIIILCLVSLSSFSQDSTYKPYKESNKEDNLGFWDKCYAGGDIMFYGGTGSAFFNISPLIGYRPNNKSFSYGLGATYQFSKITYYNLIYQYSLFGIRAFVRQGLGEMLFLHGEIENYFTKGRNVFTGKDAVITIPCASAFVGYKQNISSFSYYYLMLGYETIGNRNTSQYVYPLHPIVFKAGYILDIKGK